MKNNSRRSFIKGCCSSSLGLAVGCTPARKKRARKVVVGNVNDLKSGENLFILERLMVFKEPTGLRAISLICTHQQCLVQKNQKGFYCPCHGAVFDPTGEPVSGPAKEALSWHPVKVREDGSLEIDLTKRINSTQ